MGMRRAASGKRRVGISVVGLRREDGGAYQYAVEFTRNLLGCEKREFECVLFFDRGEFLADVGDVVAEAKQAPVPVQDEECLYGSLRTLLWPLGSARRDRMSRYIDAGRVLLAHASAGRIRGAWLVGRYAGARHEALDLLVEPYQGLGAYLSGVRFAHVVHEVPDRWDATMRQVASKRFLLWLRWRLKIIAPRAAGVIIHSEANRPLLVRAGVRPERIHVLPLQAPAHVRRRPSATELERLREKYHLPDCYVFSVGGFEEAKNQGAVVEALAILQKEHQGEVSAVFVGSPGPTLSPVLHRATQLGVRDNVRYLGYVPDEDMAGLYTLAMVLVSTWLGGPVNLPVAEAMAVGCPVICSRGPGYETQIGDAGLFVDPLQPDELALQIWRIYSDKGLRNSLVDAVKGRFVETTIEDCGWRIVRVVEAILRECPSRNRCDERAVKTGAS